MHLIPDTAQQIYIKDLALHVTVSPGESIWTESSYKFTKSSVEVMLSEAKLRLVNWYTDDKEQFALALAEAR